MTCAVAEAIMNGGQKDDFIDAMKKYGKMYPDAGYGARFSSWINSDNRDPYNRFGKGFAMRVSLCAAEELVNVPIIPLNDHSCLVLDKLGNIIEKID